MALVNTSKTIWPYNLSPLITRENAFPGFSYDVSICLIKVFRSCPVMAHLGFKQKASFKLQLAPLAVSTHLSSFHVLSGLHPKSFPTRLASRGPFSCQVCQQISSHQFLLNKLLGSSGPPPGTERKRGIALGGTSPGGARAPPRRGRANWVISWSPQSQRTVTLALLVATGATCGPLRAEVSWRRQKGPYKLKIIGVGTRPSAERTCELQVKGAGRGGTEPIITPDDRPQPITVREAPP